jgi:hypothetical protein
MIILTLSRLIGYSYIADSASLSRYRAIPPLAILASLVVLFCLGPVSAAAGPAATAVQLRIRLGLESSADQFQSQPLSGSSGSGCPAHLSLAYHCSQSAFTTAEPNALAVVTANCPTASEHSPHFPVVWAPWLSQASHSLHLGCIARRSALCAYDSLQRAIYSRKHISFATHYCGVAHDSSAIQSSSDVQHSGHHEHHSASEEPIEQRRGAMWDIFSFIPLLNRLPVPANAKYLLRNHQSYSLHWLILPNNIAFDHSTHPQKDSLIHLQFFQWNIKKALEAQHPQR